MTSPFVDPDPQVRLQACRVRVARQEESSRRAADEEGSNQDGDWLDASYREWCKERLELAEREAMEAQAS